MIKILFRSSSERLDFFFLIYQFCPFLFQNKAMKSILDDAPMTVTLTLVPAEFYDEITKKSVKRIKFD